MPPADLTSRDFRKILLIKLSAVGDVVHTIPVLNKLRRRYPMAQLDWLVTPPIAELLRHHPAISNIIEFERDAWSTPWRFTPFRPTPDWRPNCAQAPMIWLSICTANFALRP